MREDIAPATRTIESIKPKDHETEAEQIENAAESFDAPLSSFEFSNPDVKFIQQEAQAEVFKVTQNLEAIGANENELHEAQELSDTYILDLKDISDGHLSDLKAVEMPAGASAEAPIKAAAKESEEPQIPEKNEINDAESEQPVRVKLRKLSSEGAFNKTVSTGPALEYKATNSAKHAEAKADDSESAPKAEAKSKRSKKEAVSPTSEKPADVEKAENLVSQPEKEKRVRKKKISPDMPTETMEAGEEDRRALKEERVEIPETSPAPEAVKVTTIETKPSFFRSAVERAKDVTLKMVDTAHIDVIEANVNTYEDKMRLTMEDYEITKKDLATIAYSRVRNEQLIKNATSLHDQERAEREIKSLDKKEEKILAVQEKIKAKFEKQRQGLEAYQEKKKQVIERVAQRIDGKISEQVERLKKAVEIHTRLVGIVEEHRGRIAENNRDIAKFGSGISGLWRRFTNREEITKLKKEINESRKIVNEKQEEIMRLSEQTLKPRQQIDRWQSEKKALLSLGQPRRNYKLV